MNKINVFDLKKLGLITNDADDIFVVTEINRKLEDGDILGAFDMVVHSMDLHLEKSLEDQIDELEDDLETANDELDEAEDRIFDAETKAEDAEERVNYLEDTLNKHNISYQGDIIYGS